MRRIPQKLGGSGKINTAIDSIIDYLESLRPAESKDTLLEHGPLGVIRRARASVHGRLAAELFFPFRIYVFPSEQRASPNATTDWRKFRVRQGAVIVPDDEIAPSGMDGADWPDNLDESPLAEGDMTDITVASGVAKHWFWIGVDYGAGTASLQNSASPPAEWGLEAIPVGYVDTNTHSSDKLALIRNYLRADIFVACPP